MPGQVFESLDRTIAAHEKYRVVAHRALSFGNQERMCHPTLLEDRSIARGFIDPIHPPTTQITGHLLRISGHQYPPTANAHRSHAWYHVIQQRLELVVVGLGVITDPPQYQHTIIRLQVGLLRMGCRQP